jgi:hypothetical protein
VNSTHHQAGSGLRQAFQDLKSKVTKNFKNRAKQKIATEDDSETPAADKRKDRRCQWNTIKAIPKDTLKQCFKYAVEARSRWPVSTTGYTRGFYHFVVMLRAFHPDSTSEIVKMEQKRDAST